MSWWLCSCSYELAIWQCQIVSIARVNRRLSAQLRGGAAPVRLAQRHGPRTAQTNTNTMTAARPKLPSVLPSQPAVQDGKFI